MFRSALKVFKKNIWDVFAITGFVAVGILVSLLVALPVINNQVDISINKIVAQATQVSYSGFDAAAFLKSVTDQLKNLDFRNPFRTLSDIVTNNGLFRIFMNALRDANFNEEVLIEMKDVVAEASDSLVLVIKNELFFILKCVLIFSVLALICSRIIIQLRSVSVKNVGKFFASFFLNLGTIVVAYLLIILCFLNLNGAGLFFTVLLILMLAMIFVLLWACICYRNKEIKFMEMFTVKNILFLWLASIAVLAVAGLIFLIIYLFNDMIAFVLAVPLFIISNIICENIVIDFSNNLNNATAKVNGGIEENVNDDVKGGNENA